MPRSSTFSSDAEPAAVAVAPEAPPGPAPGVGPEPDGPTLLAFPRPTAAGLIAVVTFVAMGAALGYVGGWWEGEPPARPHAGVPAAVYRYNATNAPRRADVLLLGDSLMRLGVIEDRLAAALGLAPAEVSNLALEGAKPWDLLMMVERLDPPRASGPKVAVIQVDRAWFDPEETPLTRFGRYRLLSSTETGPGPGGWGRLADTLGGVLPERRQAREWLIQLRYGWLGNAAPRLVKPPRPEPRTLWDLDPAAQRRAVAEVDRKARSALQGGGFAGHSVEALRLTVAALARRGYRSVLLVTPLRRRALAESEAAAPAREREIRRRVLDPPSLGAGGVVEFPDAAALGAVEDAIFIDYGHMNRDGAELQTRKLAEALTRLGLVGPGGESTP